MWVGGWLGNDRDQTIPIPPKHTQNHTTNKQTGERHGTKVHLVYTEGDEWSPRYVWDAFPPHRRHDLSHVPHAFPVAEAHDAEVAGTVLRILEQVHAEEEGGGLGARSRL